MFKDFFSKKNNYVTVKNRSKKSKKSEKRDVREKNNDKLWTKCKKCNEIVFNKKLAENSMVCPKCDYHLRLSAEDRLALTIDEDSFIEFAADISSKNPLDFPEYDKKMEEAKNKTGKNEAVVTGEAKINSHEVIIAVMDFNFMGASMGSVVGEKITIAIEKAIEKNKPLIIFSAAGGARMQEGMLSLMQMAKTSAAIKKLHKNGNLFVSVITDPTSGGVTASFALLGDIIISEPGTLIAFAGPRVIKQTISKKLPDDFQSAEFLLEHGMIDKVVHRKKMKATLGDILKIHEAGVINDAQ
ncbi:MAG TPA: acetyl-CoA carboxylase, carboxyltransferase subunit beta [Halanaerobiales bacterium]|nr:acetyl-CoA carboxylase, carboxyltransferase subunit beta [Halanaerobiales bacterium]